MNRPGFVDGCHSCDDGAVTSKTMTKLSPKVRAQAKLLQGKNVEVVITEGLWPIRAGTEDASSWAAFV